MSLSGHLELFSNAEAENLRYPMGEMVPDTCNLNSSAAELAGKLRWLPDQLTDHPFGDRCQRLFAAIKRLLAAAGPRLAEEASEDFRLLHENLLLLQSELTDACEGSNRPQKHPQVRTPSGDVTPRVAAVAEGYFAATEYQFDVRSFSEYIQAFQDTTVLDMAELWALIP